MDNGNVLTTDTLANGIDASINYNQNSHLVESVCSFDQSFAQKVFIGVKETSGSWSNKCGNYIGTHSNSTVNTTHITGRKNKAYVYFWTKYDKNGKIIYCHSKKLCENDPMGQALYEEWIKDPETYMHNHPTLERKGE